MGHDGSEESVVKDLVRFIKEEREGESGIIYCRLRVTCDRVAKALECEDVDVAAYHAGIDPTKRNRVQSDWSAGGIQVIVATVAFGMVGPLIHTLAITSMSSLILSLFHTLSPQPERAWIGAT